MWQDEKLFSNNQTSCYKPTSQIAFNIAFFTEAFASLPFNARILFSVYFLNKT